MENKMSVYYDEEGDFLEITAGDTSNCYFDNLGNGTFKITDKKSGEIRGIALFNFRDRTKALDEIKISLPFKFEIFS